MKKLMCGACSMMLACSMYLGEGNVAYGDTVGAGSSEQPVKATYIESTGGETVYSVDLTWGDMDFEYNTGGEIWNPQTHQYDKTTTAGWDYKNSNNISVTNHSNAAVDVSLSGTPSQDMFDGDASFNFYESDDEANTTTGKQIVSAENKGTDDLELKYDTVLKIDGDMKSTTSTTSQKIGTVTVTIAPVTATPGSK